MVYSKEEEAENKRQIHSLLGEFVKKVNIQLVLNGAEESSFGMAFETGTNQLEIWSLGKIKVEIA